MTVSISLFLMAHRFMIAALLVSSVLTCRALAEDGVAVTPSSLPDAPSVTWSHAVGFSSSADNSLLVLDPDVQTANPATRPEAPAYIKRIHAGQPVAPQHARDKVLLGLRESVTPYSMLGWAASAGWSHLVNTSPNYGSDGRAFAQRLGAAAALNSGKEIFSDSVLSVVFHQDPRYYQMGPGHSFAHRAIYAVTRTIVGRTDGGRSIPNYAFILGTGGSAALTHTYYPERNVHPGQVMQTWATSLGGSSVGHLASEFGGEIISRLQRRKH
ncbi:hypothetical protein [Edaphobacter flagellatus]|uniref:hypothetical protein n=1 Tax=Edaphobacter flagellatus TaxID=1933044 RepID=UPI0021B3FAEE|nr:hypothetical protein [Edaphobacter flagellatus]